MKKNVSLGIVLLAILFVAIIFTPLQGRSSQSQQEEEATEVSTSSDGYTLFAPLKGTKAYLVDMDGDIYHEWSLSGKLGNTVYLLENKTLLATYKFSGGHFGGKGVSGGGIEILDWDGNQLWSYELSNTKHHIHHDIEYLPNGNILAVVFESISESEALSAGVEGSSVTPYGEIWSEAIFEIDPDTDSIVWEWHAWDHILPEGYSAKNYPQLIDPNYPATRRKADWLHFNAIDYNEALDQIMVSSRSLSEILVIDHDTTTAEAVGSAGDLLYRWGNPASYGESGNRYLYGQHDAEWINPDSASSNILLFNNGNKKQRDYSTVLEIDPKSYSYGNASIVWEYGDDGDEESFFSDKLSGSQRLDNGNTLICSGVKGRVFEINPAGEIVWEYTDSQGAVFRADRYTFDYPGLN